MFGKASAKEAFLDFQEKTNDAWDDGDDDLIRSSVLNKKPKPKKETPKNSNNSLQKATTKTVNKTVVTPRTSNPLKHNQHDVAKVNKFQTLLKAPTLDLEELRTLSWSGIPASVRSIIWKLLSGYLPACQERQESMLSRKRQEYHNYLDQYYSTRNQETFQDTHRQIKIDLPRMCPRMPLFQQHPVQGIFERILYIWALRHPASGYVQGMNDLLTPFFIVFLADHTSNTDLESVNSSSLSTSSLQQLEADCYWCFSRLLDGIQDNYTFAQPGIQSRIIQLKDLVSRIDSNLQNHLEKHKVEYIQFSFRWMNNLLMREMPLKCIVRLWDTYLCEPDGFASFHLYVCAAFLTRFSSQLQRERDFHGLMLLLQNFPTHAWRDEDITMILAEAYRLKCSFAGAPKHFTTS